MTPAELKAIRDRLEAAVPGPWSFVGPHICAQPDVPCGSGTLARMHVCQTYPFDAKGKNWTIQNGEFIAHAPTDIAALLDEVERLQVTLKVTKVKLGVANRLCMTYGGIDPDDPRVALDEG